MDQTRYSQLKTQRGFTYSYYSSPPAAGKSVLLFLHGFPAGSFVWRRQVPFFESLGYGLIVPDLLGYGRTDKPTDPKLYIGSGHAQDIVDILDAEGLTQVIGIGHDWGVLPLSPHAACAFLAGGYMAPLAAGSDRISQRTEIIKTFGYDVFAYMRFFVQADAPAIIEKHIDSFISLMYPEELDLWKDPMCVDGSARAWVESNKITGLPAYISQENNVHLRQVLIDDGISARLCWYKATTERAIAEDNAKVSPKAAEIHQPLLFIAFAEDCLTLPIMGDTAHAKYAKGKVTRKEISAGHWGVESNAEELNGILLDWFRGLDL
ncbi:alpha/beta-hydrolase [Mycena galopus ATCC 62051]|nr:alpha/beta-hydrolase [Mycena galopus ATCC 62051]